MKIKKHFSILASVILTIGLLFSHSNFTTAAATTLFFDGFETNNFSLWSSVDSPKWTAGGNATSSYSGSKRAQITGNTNSNSSPGKDILQKNLSTAGYNNITLSYYFWADSLESNDDDKVDVQWTNDTTATSPSWTTLFTISDGNDNKTWTLKSHSLATTAANNNKFGIRFQGQLDEGNDTVRLDDVSITGDAIPAVVCSPASQTVNPSDTVTVSATGGDTSYAWTATGGTPTTGSGSSFSTSYVASGNKTITVTSAGLTSSCSVKINNPPTITLNGLNPVDLTVGGTFTDPGATASDTEDGTLTPVVTGAVDTATAGTYTLTYTATDSKGLSASVTRTVNVKEPVNTAPTITLNGANPFDITVGGVFTDPGATGNDTEDGVLTAAITGGPVTTSSPSTFILTYTVTDSKGLTASTTRTVNVTAEPVPNAAPVITLNGASSIDLTVGASFTDPGAVAFDTEDGDISAKIVVGGDTVNTAVAGTYTITYNVSDSAEAAATQVSRTITVKEVVNTAPTITLNGASPFDITIDTTFTDPGATGNDTEDGVLSPVASGSADIHTIGTYTITYTVTDSKGLTASTTRTVNVKAVENGDESSPSPSPSPTPTPTPEPNQGGGGGCCYDYPVTPTPTPSPSETPSPTPTPSATPTPSGGLTETSPSPAPSSESSAESTPTVTPDTTVRVTTPGTNGQTGISQGQVAPTPTLSATPSPSTEPTAENNSPNTNGLLANIGSLFSGHWLWWLILIAVALLIIALLRRRAKKIGK